MWVNVEVVLRMISIFITVFLQLIWAKDSLPKNDEFYFTGSALAAVFTYFFIMNRRPQSFNLKQAPSS